IFIDPLGLKVTICDCQNFRNYMINEIAQEAAADSKATWIRGGLTVVLAGGASVVSGWGGVVVLGGGISWDLYDVGQNLGERNALAQNANHLYNLCIEQATSP
ncbi:MAG TPA: hypothetical protein VGN23_06860, partial [Verrucomicrobiae bacterium]